MRRAQQWAGMERGALVLGDEIRKVARAWRTQGLKGFGCDSQVGWEATDGWRGVM